MYKVYRCVEGVHSQNIGGEWATLREAYAQAQQAAARATSPNVHYRIQGPHPRPMPRPRGEPAPTIWYVLDDENPMPADAMRASEVLAASDADHLRSPRPASPGSPLPGGEGVRGRGQPDALNRWEYNPDEAVTYRVDRVEHGAHHTIRNGFPTEHEAQDFIKRWKRMHRAPNANLVIVARKVSRESGRWRHDWEVEDRQTDASLAVRPDDELGIGLPAQWGKGKRSRKGDYIP